MMASYDTTFAGIENVKSLDQGPDSGSFAVLWIEPPTF